jgi:hypothetical protein
MIRKLSRGVSPDRFDRFLGKYNLSGGLFAVNRRMVARAVLIGTFFALLPIPAQMLFVVVTTALIRFNIVIALVLVWLTNPLTMPFIYYGEYELGRALMMSGRHVEMEMSMEWIAGHYTEIVAPLFVGATAAASLLSVAGYLLADRLWIRSVRRDFSRRRDGLS